MVNNYGDKVYGEHTFTEAFASSINTTFAKLGVRVGRRDSGRLRERLRLRRELALAARRRQSVFPDPATMDKAHVAQASFGQGEVLATPLQMALAAAAVANGGQIMKPYIVSQVLDYHQNVLEQTKPRVWLTPLTAETAAQMTDLMVEVVNNGTGTAAAIAGVQVAGKTGTAEVENGEPHAWFAAFAPADDPQVVVAVLVENAGTGGSIAAPIARQVIAAALGVNWGEVVLPARSDDQAPERRRRMVTDLIGRVFDDRYEVLSKLGSGGMADVFLANDRLLGPPGRPQDPLQPLRERRAVHRALPP